jgi:hypothetical protein
MQIMDNWEIITTACVGLGLAASCGFRIFIPLLLASVVHRAGMWHLADGFEWVSSWPAIIALSVATVVEISAYYLPWLDNLLDTIAVPSATIAGIIVSAAFVHDVDPLLKWSLAAIAGGGTAGVINAGTATVRATSTLFTGGLANPVVSTLELVVAFVLSVLAILLPVVAAVLGVVLAVILLRFARRFFSRKHKNTGPTLTG